MVHTYDAKLSESNIYWMALKAVKPDLLEPMTRCTVKDELLFFYIGNQSCAAMNIDEM